MTDSERTLNQDGTPTPEPVSRRDALAVLAGLGLAGHLPADLVPRRFPARFPVQGEPDPEVFPAKAAEYLARVAGEVAPLSPREIALRVKRLGESDAGWRRRQCISLRAAEGIMGAGAQRLLDSSTATRVSEGFPGAKGGSGRGTDRYLDEVEGIIVALAGKLFRGRYVEWRSISNTMANALALLALTEPGDVVLSQAMGPGGGNSSYHERGPGGFKRLAFIDLPHTRDYGIDLDAARTLARDVRPRLIFIGGSFVLFPYPIRELRSIADEVGATLVYDAAHLALLIAGGAFQQPLDEGAHILTMSSHKSFGGPVGGVTLTNDATLAARMIRRTLPGFLQTRDANKLVAGAYAFAEAAEFAPAHARQVLANAKALAAALDREEFVVVGKTRGYTETHQVIVDVRKSGVDRAIEVCLGCNLLVQGARLYGDTDRPSGLRLSVAEITRLGMKEAAMPRVARWLRRAIDGEPSEPIAREIEQFLEPYQTVKFAFDV